MAVTASQFSVDSDGATLLYTSSGRSSVKIAAVHNDVYINGTSGVSTSNGFLLPVNGSNIVPITLELADGDTIYARKGANSGTVYVIANS